MRRHSGILTAGVVIALLVAGCGGTSREPRTRAITGAVGVAPRLIAAAATRLAAARAYTATFRSHIGANGQTELTSGAFDFVTRASRQTIISTGGNTPAQQNGRPVKAVVTGKLLYLLLPSAARRRFPRPWVSFTARQYDMLFGRHGGLEAIKAPFYYGASGLRGQYAQWLTDGAASFTAAGTGRIDGVEVRCYRGVAGPITMKITTRDHRSITETYERLGLTVWLDGAGRVRRVSVRSVARDATVLTQQLTITAWTAAKIIPPPAREVVSAGAL